ncbi:hypothetical protein [Streptomyces sp. NPDC012510]|uniref:hypothetical protein n=1 Tax=Streptomyces sp. NPDC012510 TaxID=3364838 RepID=UPI0036E0468C
MGTAYEAGGAEQAGDIRTLQHPVARDPGRFRHPLLTANANANANVTANVTAIIAAFTMLASSA